MEDFEEKYEDLIKRGYQISFASKIDYNPFTKKDETTFYVELHKKGKDLFRFPSKISSEEAFGNSL